MTEIHVCFMIEKNMGGETCMGDVSIIARRLESGKRVQYGWSGNGGYYRSVGARLLNWYGDPEKVEYLFGFGRMRWIGKPGS